MRVAGTSRSKGLGRIIVSGALALVVVVGLAACGGSDSAGGADASAGGSLASIIGDSHVHSLIVDRDDSTRLSLGLHGGLAQPGA